ncbi:MAG: NUDIX domain-containing protein [Chlorobi bacterium]|nr:NUDIX domain-containing protein [Chlorobiota bacterium]
MPKFTVRVYGLVVNDKNEILVSDEKYMDTLFTKFPGGGLEYGEGTRECLKREMLEEYGQEIEVTDHVYTTDFFQESLFYKGYQVIAIYYKIKLLDPVVIRISATRFDFDTSMERGQSLRWAYLPDLTESDLAFPVDRYVLKILQRIAKGSLL